MYMPEEMVKCKSESEKLEDTDTFVELDNTDTNCDSLNPALDVNFRSIKDERSHSNDVSKEVTNNLSEEVTHVKTEYGFRYAVKVHDFRTVRKVPSDKCNSVFNKIKAEENILKVKEDNDGNETSSKRDCILDTVCYQLHNGQSEDGNIDPEPLNKHISCSDCPIVKVKTELSSDAEDASCVNQDDDCRSETLDTEAESSFSLTTVEELSAKIADQDFEEITDAEDIADLTFTSIKKEEEEEEDEDAISSDVTDEDNVVVKRRGRKKKKPTDSESDGKPTVYEFDLEFIVRHGFNEYIRVFKGQKPYQCSMCSFFDTSKYRLWHHYKRHLGKEPVYCCQVCKKVFNTRPGLRIHMEIHKDVKPFICTDCGRAFHLRGALTRHMETHNKTRKYPCDICGAILSRRDCLYQHLRTHNNVKPFRCDHCNKRFTRKSSLWCHMNSHNDVKPYNCTQCSNEFKSSSSLRRHMTTAHYDAKPFICRVCKKPFKRSDQLREHVRTHSDETPYKCKFCNKSFRRLKPRNNHQNKFHIGYTSFQCRYCLTYVSSNKILQKHYKRYKIPKEVKCKYCHEKFTFECIFRKHMKTHEKEKREDLYKCKRCKKVLSSKDSLKRHTISCKKINSKKNVICSYCGKAYIDGNYFQKHLEMHKMQEN